MLRFIKISVRGLFRVVSRLCKYIKTEKQVLNIRFRTDNRALHGSKYNSSVAILSLTQKYTYIEGARTLHLIRKKPHDIGWKTNMSRWTLLSAFRIAIVLLFKKVLTCLTKSTEKKTSSTRENCFAASFMAIFIALSISLLAVYMSDDINDTFLSKNHGKHKRHAPICTIIMSLL